MKLGAFAFQPCRVSRHQALRSLDVTIGDRAGDFYDFGRLQINLHYSAGFLDVHVWKWMIDEARL